MPTEDVRGGLPRFLGIASMVAAFLAWLVPVFMLPFVNVLPYLHTTPIAHRVGLSAVFYLLACAIAKWAMTQQQWSAVRNRTLRTWKEVLGVVLGLLMAIYAAAALSGNTLGLLVRAIPGKEVVRELVVVKSKTSGSSFKATKLELSSSDQQFYEVALSKRIFGEIPKIKPGDKIKFETVENLFGTYVTRFEIKG
jgi:hypothetical protein